MTRSSINRETVLLPPGKRKMKNTLYFKFISAVEPHLYDGVIPEVSHKRVLNTLHTNAIAASICKCGPHPVLGCRPPPIADEEKFLPRRIGSTLYQLRSDYCVRLKSYLFSIGKVNDDICLECGTASHTPSHLFSCPSHPTDLQYIDLWTHPCAVAVFLSGVNAFNEFPPVVLPPLCVPPELPPP
jgi:hypothetical protein